jgi:hypothetical protein
MDKIYTQTKELREIMMHEHAIYMRNQNIKSKEQIKRNHCFVFQQLFDPLIDVYNL